MSDVTADPIEPADAPDRRLHPLSWLFVLLQQLKQFIVPLIALFFFGRGGSSQYGGNELWPLIGVGVLALSSLWQYFTYRYRVTADSLIVKSGLFERSLRQIPFARIHNVAVHQSLLHRLFGVAEVRLESAGGKKPEAQMRVLKLDDAVALESLVRRSSRASPEAAGEAVLAGDCLLQLTPIEALKLGLISNRGLVVVGAGAAALSQFSPRILPNLFEEWGKALFGFAGSHQFDIAQYALVGASLLGGLVLALRVFSVLLALLQYYGFQLEEHGRRLTVERGLLTRWRTSVPRRRIQAWTLREGMMHRLLRRRTLEIDTAVADEQNESRALRELAPVASPSQCDALVSHLLPHASWPPAQWQALHPNAWWRLLLPGVVFAAALSIALTWRFGAWGLLGLAWLAWAIFESRQHARRAGYAIDAALVAVRGGWWSRHWRFAELDKLQALRLTQSPLDRRFGMASLWLDTTGAGTFAPPLRIRYLPVSDARALYARLGEEIARRPLH